MSAGVLFAVGSVVFFLGGFGVVLVGLELFGAWSLREKQPDEDRYLDDETIMQAVRHPFKSRSGQQAPREPHV
jgi:hypothetical protein